ncbi:uncharacterized protein C8A04DRAFT_24134 [Dichotomopilus funicola]|uniref:Uncharacterized protein n=1 Tax=Dichotomopilus funicola TaxID=1934379 RepID=A0AAN6ZQR5_9PEZI|nr:hypothetical protein C8A04DRAFT_24134 [Dichotomopilus funicola]
MCGPETPSSTPRIGARVNLFSPGGSLGNLLFHNPCSPSSLHATHVRFVPNSNSSASPATTAPDENVLLSIHTTGDLTKPLADAGLMQEFTVHSGLLAVSGPERRQNAGGEGVEIPLGMALSLEVGNDGIIGRRVSMRRGCGELLADGIVGFNFSPAVTA